MYRLTNKTRQVQQINYADGSVINVGPRQTVESINFDDLFPEERVRIEQFFDVEEMKVDIEPVIIRRSRYAAS
jgi:hypothetical protein